MRIVSMIRVKNEARWLREVLESIFPLTREIFLFDDHSTDQTPLIAAEMGAEVLFSPFEESITDETRDKNYLLRFVRQHEPDYVLSIDGDEVLESCAPDAIRAKLAPGIGVFSFPVKYLWNDRQHYRADGVYARYQRNSLFSLVDQAANVRFQPLTGAKCGFHCGNTPIGILGDGCTIQADILHLGYMLAEDRLRKYDWYREKDPNNSYEDQYRHMVIGDVFPPESKFLHGGPLKVLPLSPGRWPEGKAARV